jgi:hypothetical protein
MLAQQQIRDGLASETERDEFTRHRRIELAARADGW